MVVVVSDGVLNEVKDGGDLTARVDVNAVVGRSQQNDLSSNDLYDENHD